MVFKLRPHSGAGPGVSLSSMELGIHVILIIEKAFSELSGAPESPCPSGVVPPAATNSRWRPRKKLTTYIE